MAIKILYVEDEPFLGKIVKESLESRSFEVVMLTDGRSVADTFSSLRPDICLLDIMLPYKDGFTVARELRKVSPELPIIFLTAKNQTEDVLKGFEMGGNDYIKKPFSVEELIVRINNLLTLTNRRNNVLQESILLGRFEFNPQRYELKFDSNVKKLSFKEASLLKLLCENRNSTTSRKEILMKLWGDDSFFNSRNLDVYITKLREHFKEDKSIEIITIKGIGYHFAVNP